MEFNAEFFKDKRVLMIATILGGLLLVVLGTWAAREKMYTSHLVTQETLDSTVKATELKYTEQMGQLMQERGEAFKKVETLTAALNTAKKSSGSKVTAPDGTITENWMSEEEAHSLETSYTDLYQQYKENQTMLVSATEQYNKSTDEIKKLQTQVDNFTKQTTKLGKTVTLLAGYTPGFGTWESRIGAGALIHVGILSLGATVRPVAAFQGLWKDDSGNWLEAVQPTIWAGYSY